MWRGFLPSSTKLMLWNCVLWKILGCSQQPHDGCLPSFTSLTNDLNGHIFLPPSKDASFLFVTGIFFRHDVLTSLSILNHFRNSFMAANPLWFSIASLHIFISTFFIKSPWQFCAVTFSHCLLNWNHDWTIIKWNNYLLWRWEWFLHSMAMKVRENDPGLKSFCGSCILVGDIR